MALVALSFVVAGWAYWVAATWLSVRFFAHEPHEGAGGPDAPALVPAISVLKPVKGLDFEAYEAFASFCRQDYPEYEVLFGVSDARDPAVELVHQLREEFPSVPIRVLVAPAIGTNRKVSSLHYLAKQAAHSVLVVSDSDIQVPPDCLRRVVAPLADERVGMAVTLYRGAEPRSVGAVLEALYMGAVFLPSVLVARVVLKMHFALGACIAVRRSALERAGGFAALVSYLADDYQLGRRIARLGLRVHLLPLVVASLLGPTRLVENWRRQVRWSRCTRVSRPWGFLGLLFTMPTPMSLLAVVAGGGALAWGALAVSLIVRWVASLVVTTVTGDPIRRRILLVPLLDLANALVWLAAVVGRRVWWRGELFEVDSRGKLYRTGPPAQAAAAAEEARVGSETSEGGE